MERLKEFIKEVIKEEMGGATMNAQEMSRHKKKLSKLKKVLATQGDEMIEYPKSLPNTVYNAKLINEGEEYPPYMYSPVGFSCAVCAAHYIKDGKHMCNAPEYIAYKGTEELVDDNGNPITDPTKWCSNWFWPKGK
jgi:hypothetical protein